MKQTNNENFFMKTICVYLGASPGNNKAFERATIKLAHEIVDSGFTLLYGGSSLGITSLLVFSR